ncbi:MAG: hypothetical protein ACI4D7_06090 [Lachnospiraceae bacterium]
MKEFSRGYQFSKEKTKYLVVGDAVSHQNGSTVYLCQELNGAFQLTVWSEEEIRTAVGNPIDDVEYTSSNAGNGISSTANMANKLQEKMIAFLESTSCSEKLNILEGMKGEVTDGMLESMALSLDFETGGGSVEEKYYALERYLKTRRRFEGDRLR